MFDQFKSMGALAALLKDKDRLREAGEGFREKLERMRIEGEAGGGAVRIVVDGKMHVESVHLDPALIAGLESGEGGRSMAQALILEATNDALHRAQMVVREEAERMARELGVSDLPGIEKLLNPG